jgi:hypothetical protein
VTGILALTNGAGLSDKMQEVLKQTFLFNHDERERVRSRRKKLHGLSDEVAARHLPGFDDGFFPSFSQFYTHRIHAQIVSPWSETRR